MNGSAINGIEPHGHEWRTDLTTKSTKIIKDSQRLFQVLDDPIKA